MSVSASALSQSSDASGKKCEGGVLQIQKKPRRRHLPGLLPHEYEAWASRDPSHRNTTTQEDAYKVAKSPSCRTTAWMSVIGTKQTLMPTMSMSASGGKADIPDRHSYVCS